MSTQEKVTIALNTIALLSSQINNTAAELKVLYHAQNGEQKGRSSIWDMHMTAQQKLDEAYKDLNVIAQYLGDYVDSTDQIEPKTKDLINENFKILNQP